MQSTQKRDLLESAPPPIGMRNVHPGGRGNPGYGRFGEKEPSKEMLKARFNVASGSAGSHPSRASSSSGSIVVQLGKPPPRRPCRLDCGNSRTSRLALRSLEIIAHFAIINCQGKPSLCE